MKAAIYLRVSTEDQAKHGYSLPSQRELCTARARELGADEIIEVCDDGVSGELLARPGVNALRGMIAKREIALVVCCDPDRLARNLAHQLLITDEIEKAGVLLEFVNFEWQNTPDGRLFYALRGAIAEYEKEKIKERSMRGKIQKAKHGGIPTSILSYGYTLENGEVKLHPFESEVVKLIFEWFIAENIGINAIANRLMEQGIPTKKGKTTWRNCVVKRILGNPIYIGSFIYNRLDTRNKSYNRYLSEDKKVKAKVRPESEWIKIPVPPVIDEIAWQRAQEKIQSTRRLFAGYSYEKYLLSGIISCTDCGNTMRGAVKVNRKGKRTRTYRCVRTEAGVSNQGCRPIKMVKADDVEKVVWEKVSSWLSNPDALIQEFRKKGTAKHLTDDLNRITNLLKDVERGRDNVLNAMASGLLDLDTKTRKILSDLKNREKQLLARKKEIEAALNKHAVAQSKVWEIRRQAVKFLSELDNLTFEQKQQLVRTLVRQVTITGRGDNRRVTVYAVFSPESQQELGDVDLLY